jgi:hypothetical protein
MAKEGMARIDELATEETEEAEETENFKPWKQARQDSNLVDACREYRDGDLKELVQEWGKDHWGIADLTIGALNQIPDPEKPISRFWNPEGKDPDTKAKTGAWYRYREGDTVPTWLKEMGDGAKDYLYPNGSKITDEMRRKVRRRGGTVKTTMKDILK